MGFNLVELVNAVFTASRDERHHHLRQLLAAVRCTVPSKLTPVENALPELADYLYDPEASGSGETALKLFRYAAISQSTVQRLVNLQNKHPAPLIIAALGMSNPDDWNSECLKTLNTALTIETTADAAAKVLYKHSEAFNASHIITALEHQAADSALQSRSAAISQLISHTEGIHGARACKSLEVLLKTSDETVRREIASKLAWTNNRGLTLLTIAATDTHPDVRLASAKSISHGYRVRGKHLLAALTRDDDLQVRLFAKQAIF